MIDLKSVALVGGIGMVGALWQNIKNVFAYFASILIVTIETQYTETGEAFLMYAWKNFKYVPLGTRRIDLWSRYIKPKGRHGSVAHECNSQTMTFLDGWKPIFVKKEKNDYGYKSQTQINFIRGTFNVEELMARVARDYDDLSHIKDAKRKRFEVKRFFGKNASNNAAVDSPYSKGIYSASADKPIGYNKTELGSPTPESPFSALAYNKEILAFKEEIVRWKQAETWYKGKGLKWRFGAGCYGGPGTGKTSFIRAIGQEIDVPIHTYDLTTMSNEELTTFWQQSLAVAPCIVLFEDADRIFDENRKIVGVKEKPPLTLDCLLNLINGVEPADGILVFVTANDMSKIDPALGVLDATGKPSRPGRLDRIVIFGALSEECRRQVAQRILKEMPEEIEQTVIDGKGESGAQFEARCSALALKSFWGEPKIYISDDTVDLSKTIPYANKTVVSDAPEAATPQLSGESLAHVKSMLADRGMKLK